MSAELPNTEFSVCLLVADQHTCGPATRVQELALGLAGKGIQVKLCALASTNNSRPGQTHPSGSCSHSLPVRNLLDLGGLRRVRDVLREASPGVIHAWGSFPASVAQMASATVSDKTFRPRVVVSSALTEQAGISGWWFSRQLRRAERVVASTRYEGEKYRALGVKGDRLKLIAPGRSLAGSSGDGDAVQKDLGLPSAAVLLVGGGRTQRGTGPKDAIVAFDMLRYDTPQLYLVLFNTSSESADLESFGRALAFDDFRVLFSACRTQRSKVVPLARVVVITQTDGGIEEALEAMAAGKPVVAWRTQEMEEIVEDGVSGCLVPVGDRAGLAEKIRKLIHEPEYARQMGEAGRTRIVERFSLEKMIEQYIRLYREMVNC